MNTEQTARSGRERWWVRAALGASVASACWPPEVHVGSAPAGGSSGTITEIGAEMPAPLGMSPVASTAPNTEQMPALQRSPSSAEPSARPAVAASDAGPCGLEGTACCADPEACAADLRCDPAAGLCVAAAADAGVLAPAASCGALDQPCCTDGTPSCAAGLGCSAASGSCVSCGTLQNLGFFPGATSPFSSAYAVSADGRVVAGVATDSAGLTRAFRWTASDGLLDLGDLPGSAAADSHSARALSADGSVIVGDSSTDNEPFRWTATGGMRGLGVLPGGEGRWYFGYDVSGDGQVVVGVEQDPESNAYRAFRWTPLNGMTEVPGLPGSTNTFINGVSRDGSVLVGWSDVEAIYWTEAAGTRALPRPTSILSWYAQTTSSDGSVIAGNYTMAGSRSGAFRWNSSAGQELFEPGGQALEMTDDGNVLVGSGQQGAFLWSAASGSSTVTSLLRSVTGFSSLDGVNSISADGRVLVGYGTNTLNFTEGWVANLGTEACTPP